jgi:hypothetical protein
MNPTRTVIHAALAAMAQGAPAAEASARFPELARLGFTYQVELVRAGRVIDAETVHNLMPTEGLNCLFKATSVPAAFYIGIFEGNYTPVLADTAATFPGSSTECTAYDEATREVFTPGSVSSGMVDNSASKAEFTLSATKTIYGAFMSSVATKGATSGSLISAAKFASPKGGDDGDVLRVTAGMTLSNS